MRRTAITAATIAVSVCTLSACGGSHPRTRTATSPPLTRPAPSADVLSLSGIGAFEGLCPRGARSWTLRFANIDAATDALSYRVGAGVSRTAVVQPGSAITFHLVPDATRTPEPADRFIPANQGRGLANAMTVPSTQPLLVRLYQATEPQTLRADVRLALTAIGGESGQCVLVGSTVRAYTYLNSRP